MVMTIINHLLAFTCPFISRSPRLLENNQVDNVPDALLAAQQNARANDCDSAAAAL